MKSKIKSLSAAVALTAVPHFVSAVTIDYWQMQTQSDRLQTVQMLADTFEALNPGISVNVVAVDDNDITTQVAAAAASNTLPDLISTASDNILAFAQEGIIDKQASTDIIKAVGEDRFFKGPLAMLTDSEDGSYWGVPYFGWIQGIWYRADWFAEAGLEPPTTWNNILKAAKHFHNPQDNKYGILIGTQSDDFSQQVFSQFALSNGALLIDKNGELAFNSPEMKEAIEYYKQLSQYTPAGPQSWRARDYYLQGRLAMMFYSTYIMDDLALAEAAAESLGGKNFSELQDGVFDPELANNTKLAPVIRNKSEAGFGSVDSFAVIKNEDKQKVEATKKFAEFLFDPYAYVTYLHLAPGGHNPMLRDIAQSEEYMNDPMGIFRSYGEESIKQILDGFDNTKSFTVVDGTLQEDAGSIISKQLLPRLTYQVIFENRDVDQAMLWAENEMKKSLK
ncbi:extracellular solute-binding protein [Vibrio cholerae]